MDGLLSRWMCALTATAVVGVALAAPAVTDLRSSTSRQPSAVHVVLEDPPDVRGLSVDDARNALQAWNRTVVIQVVPELMPSGVDESTVVVATATLLNPPSSPNVTAIRPVMRLALGSSVPDLTGMTPAEAVQALAARGLRLAPPSPQPQPSWVVTTQHVQPGVIVEFGVPVAATFAAPDTGPPMILLLGAAGVVLLALATLLGIRTSRRRTRRRRARLAAAVRLETHPGQVVGPDVTEHDTTVSVRLAPHHDRGTLSTEEVHR
jgi:PASTA domain